MGYEEGKGLEDKFRSGSLSRLRRNIDGLLEWRAVKPVEVVFCQKELLLLFSSVSWSKDFISIPKSCNSSPFTASIYQSHSTPPPYQGRHCVQQDFLLLLGSTDNSTNPFSLVMFCIKPLVKDHKCYNCEINISVVPTEIHIFCCRYCE